MVFYFFIRILFFKILFIDFKIYMKYTQNKVFKWIISIFAAMRSPNSSREFNKWLPHYNNLLRWFPSLFPHLPLNCLLSATQLNWSDDFLIGPLWNRIRHFQVSLTGSPPINDSSKGHWKKNKIKRKILGLKGHIKT